MATIAYTPRVTTVTPASTSSGPFLVGFRLFEADAVSVYVAGLKLDPSAYTVTATFADGYDDGATVMLDAPVYAATEIRIEGAMKPARGSDYLPTDPSVMQKMNVEFARIWATLIELRREADRSLRTTVSIPVSILDPGRAPIWTGDGFENGPNAEDIADAQANADRAEAAADIVLSASNFSVSSMVSLLADVLPFPVGSIINVRKEGFAFEVVTVGDDPDLVTAGTVYLRALPDADGFVHLAQYGAIGDGNRFTGTGTNNTLAIRRAFSREYNIKIGWGTFAVTDTIQNLKENRVVQGSGMGMCCSSPIQDRLYFNAPSCILAVGDAATGRVITRRNYRASSADPNDPTITAVIENWGAGSTFKDFSIELFCDYTDASQSNLGANWDVGFFNGCRSNVGLYHVSLLGYFRKASTYWDVTDAYGIPNLLDIYGNPVPFPTAGDDDGPEYGRGSGADGCWMERCEIRGRLPRVLLGPRAGITGADYYDWVSDATYADGRGQSGASDFRSRDCILRAEHHSNYRMADPAEYGSTLTYSGMMGEGDFTPGCQYIDSGNTNSADASGPAAAARGIVLDDLRQVTREPFGTRLGQVKELYFGPRFWAESNGTPGELYDTAGNDIFANRVNEDTHFYGHICTNEYTGRVVWPNSVMSIFTRWVYDWEWTDISDRQGRRRAVDQGFVTAAAGANVEIPLSKLRPGGFIAIMTGGIGTSTPLSPASGFLLYDVGGSPNLSAVGTAPANLQIIAPNTVPSDANVTSGQLGITAMGDGRLILRNRLAAGETNIAWRAL